MKIKQLIRFDWAMKKLLRNKANFGILEGFLTELLKEDIKIKHILDSESNKESDNDKHNRVDILVENANNELIIVEIQNSKEYDYFHRMLYGTSKIITEHIQAGDAYSMVKKVITITIAYFDLGQGKDYVYHGTNVFKGIYKGDILAFSDKQIELYQKQEVHQIYPEYWVIKVDQFDNTIKNKLDEWIYFLKNSKIMSNFSAKGLKEASKTLDQMKMSEQEQKAYKSYLKNLMDIASYQHTMMADFKDYLVVQEQIKEAEKKGMEKGLEEGMEKGMEKGKKEGIEEGMEKGKLEGMEKGKLETAKQLKLLGVDIAIISQSTGLSIDEIEKL